MVLNLKIRKNLITSRIKTRSSFSHEGAFLLIPRIFIKDFPKKILPEHYSELNISLVNFVISKVVSNFANN